MKKLVLLFCLSVIVNLGYGQIPEVDAYDAFQNRLEDFNRLIEKNAALISYENDKMLRKQYADEIRETGHELKDMLDKLVECSNPDFSYNLALATIFNDTQPGLGAYYMVQAFTDEECPDFVDKYNDLISTITFTAWRVKVTSKPHKLERLTTDLRYLKEELASL